MKKLHQIALIGILAIAFSQITSCGKDTPAPTDPCAGKTIIITANSAPTSPGTGTTSGSITATASGSTGFTYNINGGTYQSSGTFNQLAAGNYTINAKDADGCIKSQSVTVATAACPTILVTATTTNASSTTATNGGITASASGSTGFSYSLNGSAYQASGTFSNLAAGNYTITAKDVNGCLGIGTFTVGSTPCPTIAVTFTTVAPTSPFMSNGSFTAAATGGTAPYQFSKDGGTSYQSNSSFTGLAAGNYTVTAKDANGCTGSSTVTLTGTPCPTINISTSVAGADKCLNNNGTITVNASGSTGLQYRINSGVFQSSNIFTGLAGNGTNYTVEVKDANNCSNTSTANIPTLPAGPKFGDVKALMTTYCVGCHGGSSPQSGINFNDDCTIVAKAARIKARAVDATPSQMPPSGSGLTAIEKQKIVDWINAGGNHSN